jgi:hypothetical protein
MSETMLDIAGELTAEKGAQAVLDYAINYTMEANETLTASTWTESTNTLTLSGSSFTDSQVTTKVGGGTPGQWYVLQNVATGSTGLTHEATIKLYILDGATIGAGVVTPFPSVLSALASMRRDRLFSMVQSYMPGVDIDDSYLLEKLVSATSLLSHRLRVFLTPTEMLPNTAPQSEIDAFANAMPAVPYALEPPYDYSPDLFQGNTFGRTLTRQRPIISLHSMRFTYPTPNNTLFLIPSEWFRVDRKYGVINLLPIQNSAALPLNAFILSALGGGRTVPEFIEIRYKAGLENCARDFPEILDLIKKQAVLGIAEDLYVPSSKSESVSADGLSQSSSIGFKIDDYTSLIDKKVDAVRSFLFGVPAWSV